MSKRRKHPKGNTWGGVNFVAIPIQVLRSNEFASLTPYAVKLLLDLMAQYHGRNNGDLCCAYSLMSERGWRSNGTLQKAKQELENAKFIKLARQGGRNKASLYAITFYRVDYCNDKLDIEDTAYPCNSWMNKKNKNGGQNAD